MNAKLSGVGQIARWLSVFHQGSQFVELRAFSDDSAPTIRRFATDTSGLFQAAHSAAQWDRSPTMSGIYFTPNPVSLPPGRGTAKDSDVSRYRWLLIDFDPRRPAETSATDTEKVSAWSCLRTVAAALPFGGRVVADSGNGYHLCYPIDLPATEDSKATIKRFLHALDQRYSSAGCLIDPKNHNPSRIWKLYGTHARKGQASPDRPHRLSWIIEASKSWDAQTAAQNTNALAELLDGWARAQRMLERSSVSTVDRARKYLETVEPAIAGQNGSGQTFRVACILVKDFDLSDDEAFQAIADWNARCQPPWSEPELRHKFNDARKSPGKPGRLLESRPEKSGQKDTGAAIILSYLWETYRPLFKRDLAIYSGTLCRDVRHTEGCYAPTLKLIERLKKASDAPMDKNGVVIDQRVATTFFRSWAPTCWLEMLSELPVEEESAEIASSEEDRFRSAVTQALTYHVNAGHRIADGSTQIERRTLLEWARMDASNNYWTQIKGYQLWGMKSVDDGSLRLVLNKGLFDQLKVQLIMDMTNTKFTQLARRYDVGDGTRIKGKRMVELQPSLIDSVTATPEFESDTSCVLHTYTFSKCPQKASHEEAERECKS